MEHLNTGTITRTLDKQSLADSIHVRRAKPEDVNEIYKIAATVGQRTKNADQGFLMDDYRSNPSKYKEIFLERIFELDHFYVAYAAHKPVAFLMAYSKAHWLKYTPGWLDEIHWHPTFNKKYTRKFVLIDKTAVRSGLTGMGIGSKLYERFIRDITSKGIRNIFAETIISPVPNFASLQFRIKQSYQLAGMRYEEYEGDILTDLIYHKRV
jgi:N-acetylglutamate synthase-like GNAT family acetyltransferase